MIIAQVRLLGSFLLTIDDVQVNALRKTRQQSLFAYFAIHARTPISRQSVAFRLWPESIESQARADLRKQLKSLRDDVPEIANLIRIDQQSLAWQPSVRLLVDVEEFEKRLHTLDVLDESQHVRQLRHTVQITNAWLKLSVATIRKMFYI